MIKLTTTIGYGSKLAGTGGVHGSPLKKDDAQTMKANFGFDPAKMFDVPQSVYDFYAKAAARGAVAEEAWDRLCEKYKSDYPAEHADLFRRLSCKLPEGWEKALPE